MATARPAIFELKSAAGVDARQVGSKAARLAVMARAGFPVPPAFVVSTDAFHDFCRCNARCDLPPNRSGELFKGNGELKLPGVMLAEIEKAAAVVGSRTFAVRSSSTSEDLDGHSMAGQFDTFLDTPCSRIGEKIIACWASLYRTAPVSYSRKMGLEDPSVMGVIVQAQINPRWSGVIFTVDPLTKSADHFVIEWVEGLGDRLVSGRVTPQRLRVRRDQALLPDDLPRDLQARLQQVWHWARRAERIFQHPVDMEWAADNDGVHVLQARPITGLCGPETVVWTNVNMAENFPNPLTPMAWSLVDGFYGAYMHAILRQFGWQDRHLRQTAAIVDNLTGVQFGRIYYNLNNWYAVMGFFPCRQWLIRSLDHYIGQRIPFQYAPGADPLAGVPRARRLAVTVMFWPRLLKLILGAAKRLTAFESRFSSRRRKWRRIPWNRMSARQLLAHLRTLMDFVDRSWAPAAMADVTVMIIPGLLAWLTDRWLPGDAAEAEARLFQGLELVSMQPSVLIWETAALISTDQTLRPLLLAGDYAHLEQQLPENIARVVSDFMIRFGGRCYHDCMLSAPTFEERRDLFWELVQSYAQAGIHHPLKDFADHCRQYKAYADTLTARLSFWQKGIYTCVLKQARKAVALRERGRLLQSLLFGEMRHTVTALGRRLQSQSIIKDDPEAVLFLYPDEIQKLLDGKFQFPSGLADLIAQRRQAMETCSQMDPPSFFFLEPGDVAHLPVPSASPPAGGGRLRGTGVSRGIVTATARVIRDPLQGSRLQPGDILVTHATDPGWTPLFSIAGGLVLERGGMLSHGAIVAREFGIPAVVGVEKATVAIADADRLTVDGYQGTVERHGEAG